MSTPPYGDDGGARSPLSEPHSAKEAISSPESQHKSPYIDSGLVPVDRSDAYPQVVRNDHDLPEAVSYAPYYSPESVHEYQQEPKPYQEPGYSGVGANNAGQTRQRGRRKWLILGAIILLLVILAAVLGGVLGTQLHKNSKNSSSPTGNSTNISTAALHGLNGSGIAAAASPDGLGMLMYFQAPNNSIVETFIPNDSLTSNSSSGDPIRSETIVPITDIISGSPLAVITYTTNNTQYKQLFYANSKAHIMQINAPGMQSSWGNPTQISNGVSSQILRSGSPGLAACVSTTGGLQAVRVYFAADAGFIQELRWDFGVFDVTNFWILQYLFAGSDPSAGVACNMIQNGDGTTTANVHLRNATTNSLSHWYYIFTGHNTGGNWQYVPETTIDNADHYHFPPGAPMTSITDPSGSNEYVFYGGADGNVKMVKSESGPPPTANQGVSIDVGPMEGQALASYFINGSPLILRQCSGSDFVATVTGTTGVVTTNNTITGS